MRRASRRDHLRLPMRPAIVGGGSTVAMEEISLPLEVLLSMQVLANSLLLLVILPLNILLLLFFFLNETMLCLL